MLALEIVVSDDSLIPDKTKTRSVLDLIRFSCTCSPLNLLYDRPVQRITG